MRTKKLRNIGTKKQKGTKTKKQETVYAFIDSQNLNLGTSKDIYKGRKKIYKGWKLDFRKFRIYLSEKYDVKKAYLFIGYLVENKKLYDYLDTAGYELIFKPTIKYGRGRTQKTKGNVDAELVVWTLKSVYENYCDKVIIISGDGDFAVLAEFLLDKKKLLKFIVPNYKTMSALIKGLFAKRKKINLLAWLNNESVKLRRVGY